MRTYFKVINADEDEFLNINFTQIVTIALTTTLISVHNDVHNDVSPLLSLEQQIIDINIRTKN